MSSPSLSWDAMLLRTKTKLELIPDPGIFIFFKKDTTGETSDISNRYSKANNKYLKTQNKNQNII